MLIELFFFFSKAHQHVLSAFWNQVICLVLYLLQVNYKGDLALGLSEVISGYWHIFLFVLDEELLK